MLHACFICIPTCFMCTLIQYLALLGTNLLTRCHSASSCFLLFLYFRKVVQEIFSELMGQIASIIKARNEDCARRRPEGGCQVARPHPGAARPWPAPGWRLGPLGRPRLRLFAHIF